MMIRVVESQACRLCLNQCFLTTSEGVFEHPCCVFWIEKEGFSHCEACRTSEGLNRQQKERAGWQKQREST